MSATNLAAFQEEMEAKGADWQLHTYGGTYHGFKRPEKTTEADLAAGFQFSADAERRSWDAMCAHLRHALAL